MGSVADHGASRPVLRFAIRRVLRRLLPALCLGPIGAALAEPACPAAAWPLWEGFAQRFMQADGRVIDFSVRQQHSTSEGQSYAMFFALVARDRERFDRLWAWSVANLANGDARTRLPSWQWGLRDDGSWGVLDANPASDANLWFAYSLLEAGRVWREPGYTAQARTLLSLVAAQEVVSIAGLGPTLLPAANGFVQDNRIWRLNPSYLPVPLLRAFERADPAGPWKAVGASFARMIAATTPKGFAADWVAYELPPGGKQGVFKPDPEKGDLGSYDAIRTYLWAGMTPGTDPLAPLLQRQLGGPARVLEGAPLPPEKVHTASGAAQGQGPVGFSAALLPYLRSRNALAPLRAQQARVQSELVQAAADAPAVYYDQVLGLFGTGWMEQRYQFLPTGRLKLRWEKECPANASTDTR